MVGSEDERRRFWGGISHVSDDQLSEWTELIRSGKRGPEVDGFATCAINDFWLRQSLGHEQSRFTMAWLAEVLDSATEHRNPAQLFDALGLMPKPKRRPADPQRAVDVGWWIRCAEGRGYSRAEALALAAECFHRDLKTIERYRKAAADWASGMTASDETWERYFLGHKPPRPLPPPRDRK